MAIVKVTAAEVAIIGVAVVEVTIVEVAITEVTAAEVAGRGGRQMHRHGGGVRPRRVSLLLASSVLAVLSGCVNAPAPAGTAQPDAIGPAVSAPPLPEADTSVPPGTSAAGESAPPPTTVEPSESPDPATSADPLGSDDPLTNDTHPDADPSSTITSSGSAGDAAAGTVQAAVLQGVRVAASLDVEQAVAVVDRQTGAIVTEVGGDVGYDAESLTKLFTAAYYLVNSDGSPDVDLADQLRSMIVNSDDDVQTALWQDDIVAAMADRYGLRGTQPNSTLSPNNWGSDQVTADDMATFLASMSGDPVVGPELIRWMRLTASTGLDGFDQRFGFNALAGDHGSKQGWSDLDYYPVTVHSVGWTPRYFAAILQRSESADYATLRRTATYTARLIAAS